MSHENYLASYMHAPLPYTCREFTCRCALVHGLCLVCRVVGTAEAALATSGRGFDPQARCLATEEIDSAGLVLVSSLEYFQTRK